MNRKQPEWIKPLTLIGLTGLVFETLSGLLIYLGPFTAFNQYGVLLHTFIGLLWMLAFAWYSLRHWLKHFRVNFNHVQLLGYLSFVFILACGVTGIWLSIEALFGSRISYGWSSLHLLSGLLVMFAITAHLAVIWNRHKSPDSARMKRRFVTVLVAGSALLLGAQWVLPVLTPAAQVSIDFPADYTFPYGADRPFAPSLGHTESNGAYDPGTLAGSDGCGTSGCHEQILAEWAPSAHRYASSDLAFQEVQKLMWADLGAEGTRYCAGCHDPIALFSGSKNVNVDGLTSPGADEGVSCISCHSIIETDVRGNADYTLAAATRYVGERGEGALNKLLSDFLIRAYPGQHVASFSRPLFKTAEYCAACHKQFIDEQVNQIGWVQLQNQYDNWRESRWHNEDQPEKTITCRECHMPLVDSIDPAAGDSNDANRHSADSKHRSHRFLASNQVMPLLMDLPGANEHVRLTEQWLRGEIQIPEIADRWTQGPVIRLALQGPAVVSPGEPMEIRLVLTNNKTGHGFPTGPLDVIRSWVEVTVRDDRGNLIFEHGKPDQDGKMNPEAVIFKAEGVDRDGKLIDRHNLWEMVGAQFKRALFPGMEDTAMFRFSYPHMPRQPLDLPDREQQRFTVGTPGDAKVLYLLAELKYQKADAVFMDRLFGEAAGLRTPITTISRASLEIPIEQVSATSQLKPTQAIAEG